MIVVLLGPPGVGKGTQATRLADAMDWRHVSTGDLLRDHRRRGTELGQKAQAFMDRGELVPDDLIIGMVRAVLADTPDDQTVVFDGFPRTLPQAEALDAALATDGLRVDAVVVMEADPEVLVKRLSGRRSCGRCGAVFNVHYDPAEAAGRCDRCGGELIQRKDDEPATVRRRLQVYQEQTAPLVRYYEAGEPTVERVPGEGSVEDVQAELRRRLT